MKNQKAIVNGTIYTPNGVLKNAAVLIDNGKIVTITKDKINPKQGIEVLDVHGALVCPGFIDIHNNGGGGALTMDGKYDSIRTIAQAHAKYGTTSFVPTTVVASDEEQIAAITASLEAMERGTNGSKVLGIHMEGPFLNPAKGGAHNPKYLCEPSIEKFEKFYSAARGNLKILTLSPELPNALPFIKYASQKGVIVSAGHTTANYDLAMEAIEAGVTLCAHIMNSMPTISARDPGLAIAMLRSSKTMVEIVTDGVHVHPGIVDIVIKAKGTNKVVIITDSTPPAGTDNPTWELDGMVVTVKGYTNYLPDGTIAGSALTMGSAVKITKIITGLDLEKILPMASSNQARLLGIEKKKGTLEPNKDADIVVLSDDKEMKVLLTMVEGEVVHKAL